MNNYSNKELQDISRLLQRLSREEMKLKLLKDINIDIVICKLEGYDFKEYLIELKNLIEMFL